MDQRSLSTTALEWKFLEKLKFLTSCLVVVRGRKHREELFGLRNRKAATVRVWGTMQDSTA